MQVIKRCWRNWRRIERMAATIDSSTTIQEVKDPDASWEEKHIHSSTMINHGVRWICDDGTKDTNHTKKIPLVEFIDSYRSPPPPLPVTISVEFRRRHAPKTEKPRFLEI
ncbi:hypothetical protein P8452_44619 [Trifolium repens]|nr:hypothetical protein P8452_44619 [Trifolium repens]